MRIFIIVLSVFFTTGLFAQKTKPPVIKGVNGVLLVGKIDKPDDRYAIEVNLTKFLSQLNMKVAPSLNYSKIGSSVDDLNSDSVTRILKYNGFNGYLLVSVRGFDRKFKPRKFFPETLEEALEEGHLYPVYQDDISSITFEFLYYEEGKFVGYEMIKIGNVKSRSDVFEKLQKKLAKRIPSWQEPRVN
jgi:hypothetical protein